MSRVLRIILLVTLILGLVITSCASAPKSKEALVGGAAPDFGINTPDGKTISLNDLRSKPVLINFWASWCGPCAFEMPFLQETYEDWSGRGLVLLAVNVGDSPEQAERFMQEHNLSLTVLLDANQLVAKKYKITAIPTTFFIDKDGIIQEKIIGAFPSKVDIEKKLSKIIS